MLKLIGVLNPDHTNLVRFLEQFVHMGKLCLVFERLDMSLYDLLQNRNWQPLDLRDIRPLAHQVCISHLSLIPHTANVARGKLNLKHAALFYSCWWPWWL